MSSLQLDKCSLFYSSFPASVVAVLSSTLTSILFSCLVFRKSADVFITQHQNYTSTTTQQQPIICSPQQ